MIPTDDVSADRWLRKYPNRTIFAVLGMMVLALALGALFYLVVRPGAGGNTQPKPTPSQPKQATQPQ